MSEHESRRRLRPGAAALAVLTLLAACGSGPDDEGPLETSARFGGGEWCLPDFDPGGEITHGVEIVENTSDRPVEVTDVSLVGSDGFDLVDSYQRPAEDPATAGTLLGWPPRPRLEVELAPLATIEPGVPTNVVFSLRSAPEAARARIAGVEIAYRVGDDEYTTRTGAAVRWAPRCGS